MRRRLIVVAAMTVPLLAPAELPATANAAVRASVRSNASVTAVSCAPGGDCAAGGEFREGRARAFVLAERDGQWGTAIEVPGLAALNPRIEAERHGRWGKTVALPGLSALGTKPSITGLSCTAAVNCAVGGAYRTHRGAREVFVASKRNGRWGKAIEIPGFTALNKEGFGALSSLSCISAGNCVAGGTYTVPADFAGGSFAPFVASERNGHWGEAIEVPGIPPAGSSECEPDSSGRVAGHVLSASCAPGGACVAGGWYDTPAISGQAAFVVTYKNGRWTNFTQIPGLEAPATGRGSAVNSVSCTPAGKCVAGGDYSDSALLASPAFVADEINGTWGQEHTVLIGS